MRIPFLAILPLLFGICFTYSTPNLPYEFGKDLSVHHVRNLLKPSSVLLSQIPDNVTLAREIETRILSDPRTSMNVLQLVRYYGYDAEAHHVTTKDGYILELHRVLVKGKKSCKRRRCKPVLLQHGLLGTSSAWIMHDPKHALAYILADQGYDVWMGNARGNTYSTNHTTLSLDSKEFWNFSFDEMGHFDLPAVIDFILKKTKQTKLHYVGHSMGTTMFWVLMNDHPEYNKKVASMSALGPVAFVKDTTCPVRLLAPYHHFVEKVLIEIIDVYHMMDPHSVVSFLLEKACEISVLSEEVCSNLMFMMIGFDSKDLDLKWLPIILNMINGGASTRTLIHFGQLIDYGTFQKYDFYDGDLNKKYYNGSPHPPKIGFSKITTPVMLKYGLNDPLADPKDVKRMIADFPKKHLQHSACKNKNFNHMDFLWGIDAKEQVYDDVIKFMKKHK